MRNEITASKLYSAKQLHEQARSHRQQAKREEIKSETWANEQDVMPVDGLHIKKRERSAGK